MNIIPTKKQWKKWSLPSKASYVGSVITILSIFLAIFLFFIDRSASSYPVEKKSTEIMEMDTTFAALLESAKTDPRDIADYLEKIPVDKGKDTAKRTIEELYNNRIISIKIKEILDIVVEKIFETTEEFENESRNLKSKGNYDLAKVMEEIKIAIEKKDPRLLLNIYKSYEEREKEKRANLLKKLIKSSASIFAYKEAKKFYYELIDIKPSAENHFGFAYFLQEFSFFIEAKKEYEEALKIYRELANENPGHIYLMWP